VLAGPAGVVEADMLPADIRGAAPPPPAAGGDDPTNLQAMTDAAIRDALAAHGGNVSRAARALGVHRSTLYRRLPRPA
jgi:transcriptional regulator of acetoin/glycerol metabolism